MTAVTRRRPLRFATYLAPPMFPVYGFITRYVGDKLGCLTELVVGSSYDRLGEESEIAFVCGLPYVELVRRKGPCVEPLAAPLLEGRRYGGKPVYFSDVIVRRDSPFRSFADLRGRSWSYNEPHSHSGYGVTRYRLVQMGETNGFFGRVIEAGWHERSIRMVCKGEVDASAIDSHVLALALRDRPKLADKLRVIDTFGPSTIQPVVGVRRLPKRLRADLRAVLVEMAADPAARAWLARGLVERFVPVTDAAYDDIRAMLAAAEAAAFLTIR
jgi:phosphonate transport system substrate-binding protein